MSSDCVRTHMPVSAFDPATDRPMSGIGSAQVGGVGPWTTMCYFQISGQELSRIVHRSEICVYVRPAEENCRCIKPMVVVRNETRECV
jgi:hypothetical protein